MAAVRCSFSSTLIQWPEQPSGSSTVWNSCPLIVPCTATWPRDGSFSLAFSGSRTIVHLSMVCSVASKRIAETPVRRVIDSSYRRDYATFVDEAADVGGQRAGVVGLDAVRLRGQVGAAHVGRDDAESCRRERRSLHGAGSALMPHDRAGAHRPCAAQPRSQSQADLVVLGYVARRVPRYGVIQR